MNEKELALIEQWLKCNEVKKCEDSYDVSIYSLPSLPLWVFFNQKSCIPKDISWKEDKDVRSVVS